MLSQLVLCGALCLESIQCSEEQGRTEWGRWLCPLHRDVWRLPAIIKQQTPTRAAGELGDLVCQVSCGWQDPYFGKENKTTWAEIGLVEPAILPISLELTPFLHNPQLHVHLPSPLCLPQGLTALVLTWCLLLETSPVPC